MILFISGTDTGVGKTAVAAALARQLRAAGKDVAYFKPVQTGVAEEEVGDAQFVAAQAAVPVHEGQRLPAPLAPAEAARQAGTEIDLGPLLATARELATRHEVLLVEGAGGLLVPLDEAESMADFCSRLGARLVLVARPGLGTLNHTALSLHLAFQRGLSVDRIVLSGWPAAPEVTETSNLRRIQAYGVPVEVLEHCPGLDTAQADAAVDLRLRGAQG